MSDGEFTVYQFFKDSQDCEVRFVDRELAIETFARLTTNVAAQTGITKRVIITDGDDFCCMEWKFGEGITFPPELKNIDLTKRKKADDEAYLKGDGAGPKTKMRRWFNEK